MLDMTPVGTRVRVCGVAVLSGLLFALCAVPAWAKDRPKTWRIPILMEQSTVRGKVIVLEDRQDDRKVASNLRVRIYEEAKEGDPDRRTFKLLSETRTDDLGLFDLPLLATGQYALWISGMQVRLQVIAKPEARTGPEEPKVLLILIPKEVIVLD